MGSFKWPGLAPQEPDERPSGAGAARLSGRSGGLRGLELSSTPHPDPATPDPLPGTWCLLPGGLSDAKQRTREKGAR